MVYKELSEKIIEAAIEVHTELGGPGLLESIYEEAFFQELQMKGLKVNKQVHLPIFYKGNKLDGSLRIDLIIENLVIVECKAVEQFNKLYLAQCLTYLRLTNKRLGLVINFGSQLLFRGVHRVVN